MLRIAVRAIESWLLADQEAMAHFLQVPIVRIPTTPDLEVNPKMTLVNIARSSTVKSIRDDIVPPFSSSSLTGRRYVSALSRFVSERWNVVRASQNSPSLKRSIDRIEKFACDFSF